METTHILIREEKKDDIKNIQLLNNQAFNQIQEGSIVNKLRENCDEILSLVAEINDQIVGHILFSPATIETERSLIEGMGLAPMAVLPEKQKQGIGSSLIKYGLEKLRIFRCPFVIVLGHSEYYPKFGFEPASRYQLRCEWNVPDEVFMIKILDKTIITNLKGIAKYRPEFSECI